MTDIELIEEYNSGVRNFMFANLRGADLRGASLCEADLRGANLCEANLRGANLRGANLYGANLYGANLYGANLYGANLCGANLCEANLRGANLRGANLYGANLRGANLRGAKNVPFVPMICPEKGSFTGFKRLRDSRIAELRIPASAKRSSATSRKCRCNKAKVISITSVDGKTKYDNGSSLYICTFIYTVGQAVEVEDFDDDRWNECSSGIHFFMSRQEAIDYEG